MRRNLILPGCLLVVLLSLGLPVKSHPQEAILLKIEGPVGPASSDYFLEGLKQSEKSNAELVLLQLDTPGGLDTSMRAIIKGILSSPVPVVVYIAPEGARAASAGTYIVYSSHIAAMAPATNLGAATPVAIGGLPPLSPEEPKEKETEKNGKDARSRKAINDARAYLRGLAQLRGRNVDWAERAVAGAESLSAEEALKQGVIEIIAKDPRDLLDQLNGRLVQLTGREKRLQTGDAVIRPLAPGWRYRFFHFLSNPNVAYLLLLLGIYGLIYEFANPGYILPGVVGAICLLLALYGLHLLPLNYTGLALLLLGIAMMVGEAFVPSFGALGVGGIVAFLIGSLILIDTEIEGFRLSYPLIGSLTLVTAVMILGVVGMAIKARRRKIVSGSEELMGAEGEALEDFEATGQIFLHGEIWQAKCERPLKKGQKVTVCGREGLVLSVQAVSPERKEQPL